MKTIKYMRRLHKAGIAPALYPCTKEEAENSPYGVHDGEAYYR